MTVRTAPRGGFYIAQHAGLTVFDRDRALAIARLTRLIWNTTKEHRHVH